ncbi:MAG TPA: cytochrome P460 family protein [Terriglobia bacterium]|nr:cytochrome P460 family protein [Terriglobia bacterium]
MKPKLLLGVIVLGLAASTYWAQSSQPNEPRYTSDGQLMKPDNYREWIFLSSGLGMTYGPASTADASNPRFDNVFVTPQAYKAFMSSGTWPDKTMFALEVRSAATKGSINNGGHYQDQVSGLEVEVKDSTRFETKWAFFGFGGAATSAKPFAANAGCQACHSANGAVDNTFVQFYPTLIPVAKAKGTFKTTP